MTMTHLYIIHVSKADICLIAIVLRVRGQNNDWINTIVTLVKMRFTESERFLHCDSRNIVDCRCNSSLHGMVMLQEMHRWINCSDRFQMSCVNILRYKSWGRQGCVIIPNQCYHIASTGESKRFHDRKFILFRYVWELELFRVKVSLPKISKVRTMCTNS